ncbi:uncharacterized protein LOC115454267 [Manduca sexta]|uniref:uncharacterized protein LOC115454267 n=1 Tax=Manduca sexta TaxID=7130 RepID=UPI001182E3F6|nr:uncharacterized protein LOC115454267 [Manduca sexta]KAG6438666.1 hypothetical protein O3G_MSEX000130 [Manduca sexta]
MKGFVEARCIICNLVFCCADCRWNHEQSTHNLTYDCPICRGYKYLCRPEHLNQDFLNHISEEHLPLHCSKCSKHFNKMEDLLNIQECSSISELLKNEEMGQKVDDKFDSLYEKISVNEEVSEEINKVTKTAIITPTVRKANIVDYDTSDDEEGTSRVGSRTPHPKLTGKVSKLKRQRAATPHAKKLLSLMRQKVVEEYEETVDDEAQFNGYPMSSTTPSRHEVDAEIQKEMTTPTSHLPHLMKLTQTVTTSTPTHPACGGWSLFPDAGADSPLSEIENTGSPAQSMGNEPSKTDSDAVPPKLKSIIITASRLRLSSQDSSEKHVTFQDSANVESSMKKKVKFAEDTVFEQEAKSKRVYRKPRRMLTPGPQKRFCYNPRFQALINRFENQGLILTRTPITKKEKPQESTPPTTEHGLPARAIDFVEESPMVNLSRDSEDAYKTCIDSSELGMNTAITALTANIAGSLQNCLSTVFRTSEEETEIQFKFTITKKTVTKKQVESDMIEDNHGESVKENMWSCVARAVRNVFWGGQGSSPQSPQDTFNSTSSSTSKRKCEEMDPGSPLNHKRHKYEGRIRARPPLRRSKSSVSALRSSRSAEQHSILNEIPMMQDDAVNLSF